MKYHVTKNKDGSYDVEYRNPTIMTEEEHKEHFAKATKRNCIGTFVIIGIITMLISGSFGIALVAGAIACGIMWLVSSAVKPR